LRLAPSKGQRGPSLRAHSAHPTSISRTGYDEDLRPKQVRRIVAKSRTGAEANRWTEEKDLVIVGGGVAGYVAAIKAGQAGLKVRQPAI
jgi:NADPH-dependent 2,4-dienoyl-CoA reductase/sulfur reductase-like enzyme